MRGLNPSEQYSGSVSWTADEARIINGVVTSSQENSKALDRMEQALLGYRPDGKDGLLTKVDGLVAKVEALEQERVRRDAQLKVAAAIWGSLWGVVTAFVTVLVASALHL